MTRFRIAELAEMVGGTVRGDENEWIEGVAPLESAQAGQLSFLDNPKYRQYLATTRAQAVILSADLAGNCTRTTITVANPHLAYALVAAQFQTRQRMPEGIHSSAVIGKNCEIAPSARISANVVLGPNCKIGEGVEIHPNCVIGANCEIGKDSRLYANVTLYDDVILHERVTLHSGAVIGADGFGLAQNKGTWHNVPQLGRVIIGSDTDVGANTTIDRGALEDTVIGQGVKLDNLIQIGHNVVIGDHTAIAGCVGIAGSTKIGSHCIIGGGACIAGHLEITSQVIITGMAGVSRSLTEPGIYSSGTSVQPNREWRKNSARFHQLDNMARRLRELEKQITNNSRD